ncbi:MAG: addiction module protein [Burkholderiaceae bacterium]|nr:addiction module protein [Burkholderiaceae bacterium]
MSISLEALEVEVLRLRAADRARLLDRVVASLDADSARDAAWDAVAARRDAEIEAGIATEVSVDDVLARLRAELR